MTRLKVLAFDYATVSSILGGGAGDGAGVARPQSLLRQDAMLLEALQADLRALPGVELYTMAPAAPSPDSANSVLERFQHCFDACLREADAVWPLACESEFMLERLSRDIVRASRILLSSPPDTLRVTASKLALARALDDAGVASVATYDPHTALAQGKGAWVVKPDAGAGCLNTRLFSDQATALAWVRATAAHGYVLQPFVAGKLGSLSLLCCDGAARVLACNHERVAMRDNRFHFMGSTVNGIDDANGVLARLGQQVAAALPALWGYVGVDFILGEHGPVVLDVNPRLTAAYAGLALSIGCNPAGLVLDLLTRPPSTPALSASASSAWVSSSPASSAPAAPTAALSASSAAASWPSAQSLPARRAVSVDISVA